MRPIKTERSNATLVLLGGTEKNELPAERVRIYAPEDEEQTGESRPGIETTWEPDDGERKALANGAPVLLRVWGKGHPPVSLNVGDPPEEGAIRLIPLDVVERAAGAYFALLATMLKSGQDLEPGTALELWTQAVAVSQEGPEAVDQLIGSIERDVKGEAADDEGANT